MPFMEVSMTAEEVLWPPILAQSALFRGREHYWNGRKGKYIPAVSVG